MAGERWRESGRGKIWRESNGGIAVAGTQKGCRGACRPGIAVAGTQFFLPKWASQEPQ